MQLDILTPEKKHYSGEVKSVQVPGNEAKGSFEILNGHAAIVSSLVEGQVKIKEMDGTIVTLNIASGFIEAANDKVNILVEQATAIDN